MSDTVQDCRCTFAQKVVGDGCEVCNAEETGEMSELKEGWYWCKDSYGDYIPLYFQEGYWKTSSNYSADSYFPKRILKVVSRIPLPNETEYEDE